MKNSGLLIVILSVIVASFVVTSCDEIGNPYPPRRARAFVDTLGLDSIANLQPAPIPLRKVLLEDFTGHQCGNCPRAAEKLDTLIQQFGNRLIPVATHVGFFARVNQTGKFSYDFRTPTGNEYDKHWEINNFGLPQGMINRKPANSNTPILTMGEWNTVLSREFAQAPEATFKLTRTFNERDTIVNLRVETQFLRAVTSPVNMIVWLTEDSIINWQKDYSLARPDIEFYNHKHALRTDLTGPWGMEIGKTFAPNARQVSYFGYKIPPRYRAKKCHLVVVLVNPDNRQVIHADEISVADK